MKKLISLLLAIGVLGASVALTGCGQKVEEDTSKMSTDKTQASEGEIEKPAASQSRGDAVGTRRGP